MKQLIALLMALFSFSTSNAQTSIYDIAINDISGKPIDLGGLLRVNISYLLMWLQNVVLHHNMQD